MGMSGFLCSQCREMDPHLEMMRGKWGSSLIVVGNSLFLSSADGVSGNFLNCIKGVMYSFEAHEGRRDFSPDAVVEKGLIWR